MDVEENMLQIFVFALAAALAVAARAQSSPRPDPADPKAVVPAHRYESAFKDYRAHADAELVRWREVNDEVGRIGGHTGHASKAGQPAKPPSKVEQGHGGHK
jgi:hypothetical protein